MQHSTFEAFVIECLPALSRYAFKLTRDRDTSEELVQDTLVKLAGAWRRVSLDGNPVGYARTVMLRLYVSRWRRERHRPVAEPYDEATGGPDGRYAAVEARDTLRRVLRDLPRQQRVVLVLTYVDDLPDDRIAELLRRRPATIRSIRHRGLQAVRRQLAEVDRVEVSGGQG